MKTRNAVYAGTFDPPTRGHLDIARRVAPVFDNFYFVVADNPKKTPMFSAEERKKALIESIKEEQLPSHIKVEVWSGLVVDFCKKNNVSVLVRGLRAISDFESELQVSSMNRRLDSNIETFHVMTDEKYFFVSSSLIKEIAQFGAPLSEWVPLPVEKMLRKKFGV